MASFSARDNAGGGSVLGTILAVIAIPLAIYAAWSLDLFALAKNSGFDMRSWIGLGLALTLSFVRMRRFARSKGRSMLWAFGVRFAGLLGILAAVAAFVLYNSGSQDNAIICGGIAVILFGYVLFAMGSSPVESSGQTRSYSSSNGAGGSRSWRDEGRRGSSAWEGRADQAIEAALANRNAR
ncbi:MAG: hypothetical protein AB7F96_08060 [Beijerinckiaceae bacterium]